jgi:hypothetical protein
MACGYAKLIPVMVGVFACQGFGFFCFCAFFAFFVAEQFHASNTRNCLWLSAALPVPFGLLNLCLSRLISCR